MIKVEATAQFTLGKFNELKNIVRANPQKNKQGELFKGDIFECTEEMCKYLDGENYLKTSFVKVLEIIPETPIETIIEDAEETKPKTRRTRKKKIEE